MRKSLKISHFVLTIALIATPLLLMAYHDGFQIVQQEALREASDNVGEPGLTGVSRTESRNRYYAKRLDQLGIQLIPGTEHRRDSIARPKDESRCKSLVYLTLQKLPQNHVQGLQTLTLFYTHDGRRGLGGNGGIVLRCLNISDAELTGVLVHEMGHIVDEQFLQGSNNRALTNFFDFGRPILADDPSYMFYNISWENNTEKRLNTVAADFVSGYAASDPFEDFAESYAYYILHGEEFRTLTASNSSLKRKYEVLKSYVFQGAEFGNFMPSERSLNKVTREYDVTVMPYELRAFLES